MRQGWPFEIPGSALVEILLVLARELFFSRPGHHEKKNRPSKPPEPGGRPRRPCWLGYWTANGEPIILTKDFSLIDGQHRLQSCVETDLPLLSVITWGWPEECFDTIDTGVKRSGPGRRSQPTEKTTQPCSLQLYAMTGASCIKICFRAIKSQSPHSTVSQGRRNNMCAALLGDESRRGPSPRHSGQHCTTAFRNKTPHSPSSFLKTSLRATISRERLMHPGILERFPLRDPRRHHLRPRTKQQAQIAAK